MLRTWAARRLIRWAVVPRSAVRLVGPLTVLLAWELSARLGLVNTLLFPPPSKAFADLVVLVSTGYLWKALYASLFRVVCGFALAVTVGVSLGVAMARIRLVNDFVDPLVELLRPISPLAIFPLAILCVRHWRRLEDLRDRAGGILPGHPQHFCRSEEH